MPLRQVPITAARVGGIGILRFIIKHWYLIICLVVLIPAVISAISTAKETNNPTYPVTLLGLRLINNDRMLYNDLQVLKNDPEAIVGVSKPAEDEVLGIRLKYYWNYFFNVIFKFFGYVWLQFIPFVLFYKLFRLRNTSQPAKNVFLTLIIGLTFILIVNLCFAIYEGITFPENTNLFEGVFIIFKETAPFKGVLELIKTLYTLI